MKLLKPLLGLALLATLKLAGAQSSSEPIKLVLPFSAGGTADTIIRRLTPKLGALLNQPVLVDNRPGANGIIGTEQVAHAKPDGNTLLLIVSSHTGNPAFFKKLPYDTEKDFVSVAMIADIPGVIIANNAFPPNTLQEFVAYARTANPPVAYGMVGAGSYPHLTIELLRYRAQIPMTPVNYKGGGPALMDLLAGVYPIKVDSYITTAQYLKAGKIKAYAVTGKTRLPQLPDVPTVAESGFPGYDNDLWLAVIAPAGTPPAVVHRLEAAFMTATKDPVLRAQLEADGIRLRSEPGSYVDQLVRRELKQWPDVVKAAGIAKE